MALMSCAALEVNELTGAGGGIAQPSRPSPAAPQESADDRAGTVDAGDVGNEDVV
jgi:hypothetical protein